MVTTDVLAKYYGGVIGFAKDTTVSNDNGDTITYYKGDEIHITPAVLHMVGSGLIPRENFKLILRQLNQLEDSELIELAEIAAPRGMYAKGFVRTVYRDGLGKTYSVKVMLSNTISLVVSNDYNIAVCDVLRTLDGMPDYITTLTIQNQIKVVTWLLNKHLDIFNLIPRRLARGRSQYPKEWYENPGSSRFNKSKQK